MTKRRVRIDRFEIVSSFEQDETILLTCGKALKELEEQVGSAIIQLNVPDQAPPELPRALLRMNGTLLQVGLNRFQVVVSPPHHVSKSYEESLGFAKRRLQTLLVPLLRRNREYRWTGVIANLEYSEVPRTSNTGLQAVAPVFDRLLTLDWPAADLATFQLRVGKRSGKFFRNYTLAGYETKEALVAVPPRTSTINVDMSQASLADVGVQIILDINNKPDSAKQGALEDLDNVLKELGLAYEGLAEDLNLEAIL